MKKFYVYYTDKSGDSCKVWCRANDIQEAEMIVRDEYWDIKSIDQIIEAK